MKEKPTWTTSEELLEPYGDHSPPEQQQTEIARLRAENDALQAKLAHTHYEWRLTQHELAQAEKDLQAITEAILQQQPVTYHNVTVA